MKVTRTENGFQWQDETGSGSVSAFAFPTASSEKQQHKARWLQDCARRITAVPHTVDETIDWMRTRWDIEPLAADHEAIQNAYASLVQTLCADKLIHRPGPFRPQLTKAAFARWRRETEARQQEAAQLPASVSGLVVCGFRLPHTPRNLPDMQTDLVRFSRRQTTVHPNAPPPTLSENCLLIFEKTTANLLSSGVGSGEISRQAVLYLGVTEEDIRLKTPRLEGYCHCLREQEKAL